MLLDTTAQLFLCLLIIAMWILAFVCGWLLRNQQLLSEVERARCRFGAEIHIYYGSSEREQDEKQATKIQ